MGTLSRKTLERLTLLAAIAEYPDGCYGRERLQKVVYFGSKDARTKPFTFKYWNHGQYSWDIADRAIELATLGLIIATPLETTDGEREGDKLSFIESDYRVKFQLLMEQVAPDLSGKLREAVLGIGMMKHDPLEDFAHEDPALQDKERGDIILESNLEERTSIPALTDEECEDIELCLNPALVSAARRIVRAVQSRKIDLTKVRSVTVRESA